jgi:hypothetical protein
MTVIGIIVFAVIVVVIARRRNMKLRESDEFTKSKGSIILLPNNREKENRE